MNITQEELACNSAVMCEDSELQNASTLSITGNIVPHCWYHKILRECGKADINAITILSELLFLHRAENKSVFQLPYKYFKSKFNFGLYQVRDAVIRLEKLSLLKREFRTISVQGRLFSGEMFLVLNIKNLSKISDTGLKKFAQSAKTPSTEGIEETSLNKDKTNLLEYRSNAQAQMRESKSNFKRLNSENHKPESKPLSSFHPLSKDEVSSLKLESKREFNTNFVNQLMLRIANKYPDKKFPNKQAVMSYMSKILQYEMRQASQVNNESFKFAPEDKKASNIEKFLESVENCKKTDQISQLRRKIAGIFEPQLAHSLLCSSYFKLTNAGKLFINTASPVALNETQSQMLLAAAKSVFCNEVTSCSVVVKKSETAQIVESDCSKQSTQSLENITIWGKIRHQMKLRYGEATDKSWFSKIEEIGFEVQENVLTLKASSSFTRDWLKSHYLSTIEQFAKSLVGTIRYVDLVS